MQVSQAVQKCVAVPGILAEEYEELILGAGREVYQIIGATD